MLMFQSEEPEKIGAPEHESPLIVKGSALPLTVTRTALEQLLLVSDSPDTGVDTGAVVVRARTRRRCQAGSTRHWCRQQKGRPPHPCRLACLAWKSLHPTSGNQRNVVAADRAVPWLRTVALNVKDCLAFRLLSLTEGDWTTKSGLLGGGGVPAETPARPAREIGEVARLKLQQTHYLDRTIGGDRQPPLACSGPEATGESRAAVFKLTCGQHACHAGTEGEAHCPERRGPALSSTPVMSMFALPRPGLIRRNLLTCLRFFPGLKKGT